MGARERWHVCGAPRLALAIAAIVGIIAMMLVAVRPAATAPGLAPGQPAPGFTGTDTAGRPVSLADYRGSIVVLEWTNHDCPFVRRHYDAGNMQALQK